MSGANASKFAARDNGRVSDELDPDPDLRRVSTVHLGQYTRETANAIAGELEAAGIVWWYKEPGFLSQVWEFGVRLFVDRDRLAEAQAISDRITTARNPATGSPGEPPA
jgi:hypothetical protein